MERRFTVALDSGIQVEHDLINLLKLYPRMRRQQRIRQLLLIGAVEIKNGRPYYNLLSWSAYEPLKFRIEVRLHDSVPEDQPILRVVKDVQKCYQARWLLTALVFGFMAEREQEPLSPAVGASSISKDATKMTAACEGAPVARVGPGHPVNIASLSPASPDTAPDTVREREGTGVDIQDLPPEQKRPVASVEQGDQVGPMHGSNSPAPKLPGLLNLFQ